MTKPAKWPLRPAKTQIRLGIRPVWSESSLCARRDIGSLATYWAHSEESDQTGHPPSLIRVFAVRTKRHWVLSYPLSAQRIVWSDWTDAQADLSLLSAETILLVCHEAAYIVITKTRLFKYIENSTSKNWKFSDKNSDIFQISAQNIDWGYSLEPPRRGGSNEYPQSMFWAEIRKIMFTPVNPSFTI